MFNAYVSNADAGFAINRDKYHYEFEFTSDLLLFLKQLDSTVCTISPLLSSLLLCNVMV